MKKYRKYSDQMKQMVLEQVNQGTPVSQAAKKFRVNQQSIRNWRKAARKATAPVSTAPRPVKTDVDSIIVSLREENRRLKLALGEIYARELLR